MTGRISYCKLHPRTNTPVGEKEEYELFTNVNHGGETECHKCQYTAARVATRPIFILVLPQSGTKVQIWRPGPEGSQPGTARPLDFSARRGPARPGCKNRPGRISAARPGPQKIACPDGPELPGWAEMGIARRAGPCHSVVKWCRPVLLPES